MDGLPDPDRDDGNKTDNEMIKTIEADVSKCDPTSLLSLLQKSSPHLRVLKLRNPKWEHVLVAIRMPRLQALSLRCRRSMELPDEDAYDLAAALPSKEDLPVGKGLQKLTVRDVPWPALLALLSTHRNTLQRLKVEGVRQSGAPPQQQPPSAPLQLPSLTRLQKLTLLFSNDSEDDADEDEGVSEVTRTAYLGVLSAARPSLEELVLFEAPGEFLQATWGMPRLRTLSVDRFDSELLTQELLQAEPEDDEDATTELRSFKAFCWFSVAAEASMRVLLAYRRTLEEVDLTEHVTRRHLLLLLQQMPRLRRLRLNACVPELFENPTLPEVAEVQGDAQLRSLVVLDLPMATVLCLLSLHAGTLEELELTFRGRPEHHVDMGQVMVAVARLPHLLRFMLDLREPDSYGPLLLTGSHRMRLERLEVKSAPSGIVCSFLAASRDTLQEVVLDRGVGVEELLEVQRLQALRALRVLDCEEKLVREEPALPRPPGGGAVRLRTLTVRQLPRQTLLSLLTAHAASLEHLELDCAGREHLLATLRMPALRRLCLQGVRPDLREPAAALPEATTSVAGAGLDWLRIGKVDSGAHHLPFGEAVRRQHPPPTRETIRCLLTAHRHSLRHLELDMCDELQVEGRQDGPDDTRVWPAEWRDLHEVVRSSGLERLETVTLNRCACASQLPGSWCHAQVSALLRVLPGTAVRCSVCHTALLGSIGTI